MSSELVRILSFSNRVQDASGQSYLPATQFATSLRIITTGFRRGCKFSYTSAFDHATRGTFTGPHTLCFHDLVFAPRTSWAAAYIAAPRKTLIAF
jgi:hypothetical protein